MFAVQSEERSLSLNAQTLEKCMSWPASKKKKARTLLPVTLPPLCKEQALLSSGLVSRPAGHIPVLKNIVSERSPSVVELPQITAKAGPARASDYSKCSGEPRLKASDLDTKTTVKIADGSTPKSSKVKDKNKKVTVYDNIKIPVKNENETQHMVPLTGAEVAQMFTSRRGMGKWEQYFLKEVDGDSYRPYDLRVVDSNEAGSEHYIFSPNTVLRVTERGYGGHIRLSEWYREYLLWTALQKIPFFRDFKLRKAFTWWNRNVRKLIFQQKCRDLQDMLLISVPQFRKALFLFTRVMEELKESQLLPQDESKTYTLLEFREILATLNQERLHILEKLQKYRAVILSVVRDDSYKAHQKLQLHMEHAKKPNQSCEPIYLHVAHQRDLKSELAFSERTLQKLGNFSALINQMTVQTLAMIIQHDAVSFLSHLLKRKICHQHCLFQTALCFSASGQLTVDPPISRFQQTISEALLTVGESIIQMCNTCGFFGEIRVLQPCSSHNFSLETLIEPTNTTGKNIKDDATGGDQKLCCRKLHKDLLSCPLVSMKCLRLLGCYNPLPRRQLEWQISTSDITKRVEKKQAKFMQEANVEILQLCESFSWLLEIHMFVGHWNEASLESMIGGPVLLYEEHIQKIRHWAEIISRAPSSISTSNQLFTVQCTDIKEHLGQRLKFIEEEVLKHLTEQIQLRSKSIISDLEKAAEKLRKEPVDLYDLSIYALLVREAEKMLADSQKRFEYIQSLQDTVCMNYRNLSEHEVAVKVKVLNLMDDFIPLIKQADGIVNQRLPLALNALNTMFSFLVSDFKNVVAKASSGPFLDPSQDAKEMVSTLSHMCAHVHYLSAQLEQLSRISQNLTEHPLDLSVFITDVQIVKTRKKLWEMIDFYTTWIEEWKQSVFSQDVVSLAQRKIAEWKEAALCLTSVLPPHDAVIQTTLGTLESLNNQLEIIATLQSPTLKQKHWKAIFEGMGIQYVPDKDVIVAEILVEQLEVHQKLLSKICRDAQAEFHLEQTFEKLQQERKATRFQLNKFTLSDWLTPAEKPSEDTVLEHQTDSQRSCTDARFIIFDLDTNLAEIENDLMTLSIMLKSPYSVDVRLQVESWVKSLQELEILLHLFGRYQQTWTFLTKMFRESFSVSRVDLVEQFQQVDKTFKEIMQSISIDPRISNFVDYNDNVQINSESHPKSLYTVLTDGLFTMENISRQIVGFLDTICQQFPRLWFLSNKEVMQLLSFHPTAFTLQPFVRKCFQGVHWIEVDCDIPSNVGNNKNCRAIIQNNRLMHVLGVYGSLQEHITFLSAMKPEFTAVDWFSVFEKHLHLTMVQLVKRCYVERNQLEPSSQDLECDKKVGDILLNIAERQKVALPVLELLHKYPLQSLLVAEEAVWCQVILRTLQDSSSVKLRNIKAYSSEKLKSLCIIIRDGLTGVKGDSVLSNYMRICLQALVQLTANHIQRLSQLMDVQFIPLELSFEWSRLMRYYIDCDDKLTSKKDPACHVEVLGFKLRYDYEYYGPEDWIMMHTSSTDQAKLGILFALTSYRCGYVGGPRMSGRRKTATHLGKALGRQVVSIQCCPSMRPTVLQQMLLGALQTGAWLLLGSVELLSQGAQTFLGQHLVAIHQSFNLTQNKSQKDCENLAELKCPMIVAGKSISANLNFGCVLIPSKGYTSKLSESLQSATRPVALTHPDYGVLAELMLMSVGFSDAMSLSRHLVSLLSLANDLHCLPGFIPDNQSCYLIVLQRIVSFAEIHLQQVVRKQEIFDDQNTLLQRATTELIERNKNETSESAQSKRSDLSVVQVILEEIAIVKAILSVLSPVFYQQNKGQQFYVIFKETFPMACHFPIFQQHIREEEKNQLQDALAEELQRTVFHSHPEIIRCALTLYQSIKTFQAIMLIGPSGSGKTTCYSALAESLNQLAAKTVGYDFDNDFTIKDTVPQISASNWTPVKTLVLFPNAMSYNEIFGFYCEKKGWQDGAVAKVLRDLECPESTNPSICYKSDERPIMKWLVMDGNPAGQPGWLDYLSTLCITENPFICLSSGETLASQPHLKLLMEITDLRDASPSAVTSCSLIYYTGTDLWKTVWMSEIDALSFEHKVDQGILKMWKCLAEDLFSSTLRLLRKTALTSAIHNDRESSKNLTYGVQEIMSFLRILRALLQYLGNEVKTSEVIPQGDEGDANRTDITETEFHANKELAQNLFLIAYIWGFSGHLHPRHWPQFEFLARHVLFASRYKIVVPDNDSVYEHFFANDSKICPKTLLTNTITPKYGKHSYLLNIMGAANQPVLLAGEPGSGKTTLCKTLLRFERPHISLPLSPLVSTKDLLTVMKNCCQKNCKENVGSLTKQPRLLLFVDDLHEAPYDVHGNTSSTLEMLRQSISKGEVLSFHTYHFKTLNSRSMSYLATCCLFGLGNHHSNVISSRLSRLFSILVLPSLSMDVILSMYSPRLKSWLKDMSLQQSTEDMACCIITATTNLYNAICDMFQPTQQRPHFIFSHHDLQKVFGGLQLWKPNIPNPGTLHDKENVPLDFYPFSLKPGASVLKIVYLWMHECMRTFSDRVCSEDERKTLASLITKKAMTHYQIRLFDEIQHHLRTASSLAGHMQYMDAAGTCESVGQSVEKLNLPQDLDPIDQPDPIEDNALTETSPLCDTNPIEDASQRARQILHQILQHMENIVENLVYGPDFSEAMKSLYEQGSFRFSFSYKNQDLFTLQQELCALLESKEQESVDDYNSIATKCFIHRQRVLQLLHILRALLIPDGHGVLLASDKDTGRKTTVRLAAHLTGYMLMEVHPGNEDKLQDILKEARNQTRADEGNVIILVHEGISHAVREELLLAVAHRTYPGLYAEEHMTNLLSRLTAGKNSKRYLMDSWSFMRFLSEIHRNIHVFLLLPLSMSDISEIPSSDSTHGWNPQLTKALSLGCCVEVYQPWSNQSLMEVAAQCLKSRIQTIENEELELSLPVAMAGIHQSACHYASVLLQGQPFGLRTYTEFIAHFCYLYNHLHKLRLRKANRVATVFSHLDIIKDTARKYNQHMIRLQERFAATQELENKLLQALDDKSKLHNEACEACTAEEIRLFRLEEHIIHAQEEVEPVFLSGLKILNCLNSSDLDEVRHYRDPPEGVVKIMDAVCLLFNRPPGWASVKQLLGQSNFFQELEFFDRSTVTEEKLQQLCRIVHSPYFVPESVREVSKACESLCRWVLAVFEYCSMQHKLVVMRELEMLAKETRVQLHIAKQHREDIYLQLEEIMHQLWLVQEDLEEQLMTLYNAESADRAATTALEQLEEHATHWKAAAEEARLNRRTLHGDALILAGIISYLGPFRSDIRTELLSKWKKLCQTGDIDMKPEDPRNSLFTNSHAAPSCPPLGFPIPLSEKLQMPLAQALGVPQGTPTRRMILKLLLWGCRSSWVQCWPLLADTEQHLDLSSQSCIINGANAKLEDEVDCGMVVCADDQQLLEKLDQAAEKGLTVLLTHLERASPCPQFLARLARSTGFCGQQVHPEFCLFLSTQLPVRLLTREIHPVILAQVRVVDLSLSSEEIQGLMLTQLLQSQCKQLLMQHLQFQNDKQLLEDKVVSEEEVLMDYILESNSALLQDSYFLVRSAACQEEKYKAQTEIQQVIEELEYHRSLMAEAHQVTGLAASLYEALQQVSLLSPIYYFPLREFITAMQEVYVVKDRPLVLFNTEKLTGSTTPEVKNRMVTEMLLKYRTCLMKSHYAVLKLLVSVALLQNQHLCPEVERLAFLRGLQGSEQLDTASQSSCVLPSWIPSHVHQQLISLENIPAFEGLIASLSACPEQWQEYLRFPSPTVAGPVPCLTHARLTLLQRALLWKTMIPDCLEGLADAMAVYHRCLPGQTAESEAQLIGNPKGLLKYIIKHKGPIILTLASPKRERWKSVQPLHLIDQLIRSGAETKKVKVISFGTFYDTNTILLMLDRAVKNGQWLIFNHCHLLEHWDEKIVRHLCQLTSYFNKPGRIHPKFRLWFITHEYALRSIPVTVRMSALPLVCDCPSNLTEELSSSLLQLESDVRCQSLDGITKDDVGLLLRCAIFHSVLLHRQTYKYSGQGTIYSWSQDDLLALVSAYIDTASLCEDKSQALRYIAVNIVYGGHVHDTFDSEVVESAAKAFLSRELPLWFCEGHILSDIINNPDNFDLAKLPQILDQALQKSVEINDPRVLGFRADVASEIIKTNSHNLNILLQASQTPLGAARSFCIKMKQPLSLSAYSHARDRLQALNSSLIQKNDSTDSDTRPVSHGPLLDFLQTEWDDLIDTVSSLVSLLQQPFQYGTSTFAALPKLADVARLERRAELLSAYLWHQETADPPHAFRLSAFKNPKGLLVAMMRQAARGNRKYVSDIDLDFQVLSGSTCPTSLPPYALFLCGLELRGASWDAQLGALKEADSPQSCPLPLVCVEAKFMNTETDSESCPSENIGAVHSEHASPSVSPKLSLYHCPLCLDVEQESEGEWVLADVNVITTVPLCAKIPPVLCSLRRVKIVSVL